MAGNALQKIMELLAMRKRKEDEYITQTPRMPIPPQGYMTQWDNPNMQQPMMGLPGGQMPQMPPAQMASFGPQMSQKRPEDMSLEELMEALQNRQKYAEALQRAQGQ